MEKPIEDSQYEKFFGINIKILENSIYSLNSLLTDAICQEPQNVDFPLKNHKNFQVCASTYICNKIQLHNFKGIENFKQIKNILIELEIMYMNSTYYIENNYQIVNFDLKNLGKYQGLKIEESKTIKQGFIEFFNNKFYQEFTLKLNPKKLCYLSNEHIYLQEKLKNIQEKIVKRTLDIKNLHGNSMSKSANRTKRNILTNLFYDESSRLNDMSSYLQKLVNINNKNLAREKIQFQNMAAKSKNMDAELLINELSIILTSFKNEQQKNSRHNIHMLKNYFETLKTFEEKLSQFLHFHSEFLTNKKFRKSYLCPKYTILKDNNCINLDKSHLMVKNDSIQFELHFFKMSSVPQTYLTCPLVNNTHISKNHHTFANGTNVNNSYRLIRENDIFITLQNVDVVMVLKTGRFGFSCSAYLFILVNEEEYNCTLSVLKYIQGPLTSFQINNIDIIKRPITIGKIKTHLQNSNQMKTIFKHFQLEKIPTNEYGKQFHQIMNHPNTFMINGVLLYILILLLLMSLVIVLIKKLKTQWIELCCRWKIKSDKSNKNTEETFQYSL